MYENSSSFLFNFPTEQRGLGGEAGGGNPSTVSLSLLVFGSKIAFSAGKGPWEQEAPAVFGVLWCSRSHDSH